MNNKELILNLIGIAKRANLLISGEGLVIQAVRAKKAKIVFLASNSSSNTRVKVHKKAEHYQIRINDSFSEAELSKAIGQNRKVIAITDVGIAKKIQKLIDMNIQARSD